MVHASRDKDVEDSTLEPIAIVGMACRLPGAVDSASALWDLLKNKGSGQTPKVPANRFNIDAHYHESLERPGSFNVLGGYFLDGALEDFDPTFFNVTPIEAMWMDPQQRKMLEVSYECLESAGLSLQDVSGSNTAVYIGSFTSDYQQMSIRDPDFRHNYAATGVDPGIISNRIGNTFNLRGPSFTINTACSSSVYAIHNACNALRARDCEAAIAGGVNLILTVDQHMNTAKLGILSPTSTCHTFDASADGYGRAEGVGALYLKPLSAAIRDGDPVRGVIRSSFVNTNGKVDGMGITHPSVEGQGRVLRNAYKKANLNPNLTAYAECHGTGTPVGDPIEVRAIATAMNDTRSKDKPLLVGAIKANIGHSEAASGIFAVMKGALMTENGIIPGVAGFKTLNPNIKEKDWNVKVNVDTVPWPAGFPVRRASVSSFGYGGTNGHVIVEAVESLYPWYQHGKPKAEAVYNNAATRPLLVTLSAHDKPTLTRQINAHAKVADKFYLADLAYTLNEKRSKFSHKAYTIAYEGQSEAWEASSFTFGSTNKGGESIGFIFTGQGAQWAGMGVEALKTFPSFLETIRALDRILQSLSVSPSWKLEEILLAPKETSRIAEAEIAQPICTAIQIAVVDLLASWNINPTVTVGHSSGEIGAAYAAGLLSAPEAIIAAFYRGLAVKQVAPVGSMLAVGLGVEEAERYLANIDVEVVVACQNSPSSVTLSGTPEGIAAVKEKLDAEKVFARELRTGKAYHSPQMAAVAQLYEKLLLLSYQSLNPESLLWRQPRARWISSVTGEEYIEEQVPLGYWSENLRNRVLFDVAVTTLGNHPDFQDVSSMIEIGPHSALAGPFKQICIANKFDRFKYIPTLIRNADGAVQLLKTAGELVLNQYNVDFEKVNAIEGTGNDFGPKSRRGPRILVDLPPYQWNYAKRYWAEPRFSHEQRNLKYGRHDILGSAVVGLSDRSLVWKNQFRHRDVPWLKDHTLGGAAVFPAAGHMSMAIEALRQVSELASIKVESVTLRDVDIKTALVVPDTDNGIEVQVRFQEITGSASAKSTTWYSFAVESITDDIWTTHCEGRIAANHASSQTATKRESPIVASKLTQRVPGKRWYDAFHRVGFTYEGSFQPLKSIRSNGKDRHAIGTLDVNTESGLITGESRYVLHPATIDATLQLIIISINKGLHKEIEWGVVPLELEEVTLWFPGEDAGFEGQAIAWTDNRNGRYFNTNTILETNSGKVVLEVKNLRCVAYEAAVPQVVSVSRAPEPYQQVSWKQDIASLSSRSNISEPKSPEDAILTLVELLDHKSTLKNVLILGNPTVEFVEKLSQKTATAGLLLGTTNQSTFNDFSAAGIDNAVTVISLKSEISTWKDAITEPYSLLIVDGSIVQPYTDSELLDVIKSFVEEDGKIIEIITKKSEESVKQLNLSSLGVSELLFNFPTTDITFSSLGAYQNGKLHEKRQLTIVSSDITSPALKKLLPVLDELHIATRTVSLDEAEVPSFGEILVHDSEGTLLSTLNSKSFDALKRIVTSGKPTAWVTSGVVDGSNAFGGLSTGFLRAIRSEQAAAKITLLDVGVEESASIIGQTLSTLLKTAKPKDANVDTEYWLHDGTLHIPRLVANVPLNEKFWGTKEVEQKPIVLEQVALKGAFANGQLSFQSELEEELADSEVEIQVSAFDFQKTDVQPNKGRGHYVIGNIVRVGRDIDSALINETAAVYTKNTYSTRIRAPKSAIAITTGINTTNLAASLLPLSSALNAVVLNGKVQKGEHILLLPTSQSFIKAVVSLSRVIGFTLSIIVRDTNEVEFLAHKLHLPATVFAIAEDLDTIRSFFSAKAPRLAVAQDFSALAQDIWRLLPAGGQIVLNDGTISQTPDVVPFLKGVSLIATGLDTIYKQDPTIASEALKLALKYARHHKDTLVQNPVVYDISVLDDNNTTFESLVQPEDIAAVVYNYGESLVKILPITTRLTFPSDAAYILVGCLGGLGRSLTSFMRDRGVQNFVFISRSGADKSDAATVVKELRDSGASVDIHRADASDEAAVAQVISEVKKTRTIRGVVHAAMVLQDGMFDGATYESYKRVVDPKVLGAINLHKALEGTPLDFFVVTSSISAVLGNPGQVNYSAANSFLDAFAWHRNKNGLAATSLALPMVLDVGVVAENENIELSLLRKGMYGIDEREMLRGFEAAMSQPVPTPETARIGDSQLILGLEPTFLAGAVSSSDAVDPYWFADARLNGIRTTVESLLSSSTSGTKNGGFVSVLKAAAAEGPDAILQAIAHHTMQKCSSILMLSVEDFEYEGKSIASYGLDSMIGAELRNWLFKEFQLDIGFQTLLTPAMTFKALSITTAEKLGLLEATV